MDRTSTRGRVLVVAPRFPSINQPWMDTYLEQLLRNGIEFAIATEMAEDGPCSSKVDELGLRDYAILIRTGQSDLLRDLPRLFLRHPLTTFRSALNLWRQRLPGIPVRAQLGFFARALLVDQRLADIPNVALLHIHSLHSGQYFVPSASRRNIPVVTTFHGLAPKGVPQVSRQRREMVFRASEAILVNTEFAKNQATGLGAPTSKITIMPQGLPLDDFPNSAPKRPPPDGQTRILSVGRFHRDKGQLYSLLAARRLISAGQQIAWHFVGIGPDQDKLRQFADKLGLHPHVQFFAGLSTSELQELYAKAHLFVLASTFNPRRLEHVETQGVVLQEAQASGCIPVATRVGGIPECINHDIDGLLVRDRSHRAIYDAVSQLIQSPQRWPAMQAAARRNVEENFSADVIGKRMATLLRQTADV